MTYRSKFRLAVFGVLALMALMAASEGVAAEASPRFGTEPPVQIVKAAPGQKLSIVAQANLKTPRSKPPFDVTGMWKMQRSGLREPPDWEFRPMPKLTPAGQAVYDARNKAVAEGRQSLTDQDAAACYPVTMPRLMTRVWLQQMIQLPTAIVMISGFTNGVRWIYLDGREHSDPDIALPTWNGESIGRWEGNELVIDTRNFEGAHTWIQNGVPFSDQLRVIERWRLIEDGKVLEIKFTMTDPVNWVGEWVDTKRWNLNDDKDITETHCIAAEMANLPSARSAR